MGRDGQHFSDLLSQGGIRRRYFYQLLQVYVLISRDIQGKEVMDESDTQIVSIYRNFFTLPLY